MLANWLTERERTEPPTYAKFLVRDVREARALTPEVEEWLRHELFIGRVDPAFVVAAAEEMGWQRVSELVRTGQPTTVRARRGYFGEILAAALTREFGGYAVPVLKFRFAPNPDISPPATDILALKMSRHNEIAEVCLAEVKLRTSIDRGIGVVALTQLLKDRSPEFPNIIRFALQRMYESGSEYFRPFARYLGSRQASPAAESSRLFLVFESSAWAEDVLGNLNDLEFELEPLEVHVVRIDDLATLSDRTLNAIGVQEVVDGD